MRKMRVTLLVVMALLIFTNLAFASPPASKNFIAILSGGDEVPARDTRARGTVIFHVSGDGSVLEYKLIVANIENVFAAHIHCGVAGVNAPVGLTLFMGSPGSGRVSGVIASGSVTGPDAVNNCGWVTIDDVVSAIVSGGAYVNVHTNDGAAPTNTGPGDFPGGEIRGQVRENGPTQ